MRSGFSLRSLCTLWFACVGCTNGPRQAPPTRPAAFVETVPGSSVRFTMVPVAFTDDSSTRRVLWFAETETTWDAYDVFYLRLDEQAAGADVAAAGHEGPDAITRPTLPYNPPDRGWGHGGDPAIGITFNAATKYCEWLSVRTGKYYRLPTHAEWLACGWDRPQAGEPISARWTSANSDGTTHPVGQGIPNTYGL